MSAQAPFGPEQSTVAEQELVVRERSFATEAARMWLVVYAPGEPAWHQWALRPARSGTSFLPTIQLKFQL